MNSLPGVLTSRLTWLLILLVVLWVHGVFGIRSATCVRTKCVYETTFERSDKRISNHITYLYHFNPHFGPKTHLELAVKANAAEAKVGQLEVTGPRNQHVVRFHVAMHNSLGGRGDLIIQIIKKTLKIRA